MLLNLLKQNKMKALKSKFLIILIVLQITGINHAFSEKQEYVKEIHKEYTVNQESLLDITNKYGDITIKDWDKDLLTIDVLIKVESSSKEKADKKLSYINIKFSEEDNVIKAVTEFDEKFSNTSSSFLVFSSSSSENFSIDYTVHMPRYLKMNLYNKYGSIFINEIHGKSNIILKYGHFKANKLLFSDSKPLSTVSLSYCEGEVEKCNWVKYIINYSGITINDSKALIVVSKYSKVNIENNVSLVSESKYDRYKLGDVNNLVTVGKYTDYKIEKLSKKLDLDTKYGNCRIGEVPAGFKDIKVVAKYADIDIGISSDAGYSIKGKGRYGDLDYNESKANVNREIKSTSFTIEGTIGAKGDTGSKVYIEVEYGDVDLRE